jgi:heme/copper-type cytochrome/quinol oxidase subunit 4
MLVSSRATLPEFNSDSLAFWAYRIVAVVPSFVIGYALLRRRNWGRYVLIAYNLWWLVLMTYILLTQSSGERVSMTSATWGLILIVYVVLGGLIWLVSTRSIRVESSTL